MGVPLLHSLNYNIFDVSTLPLHNSLQMPSEVPGNQRENAWIFSKQVENMGDIFSQTRNRCPFVCVAPVLYITPVEIVQRTEIRAVWRLAPAPLFLSGKWFEMTRFLTWVSSQFMVRSAVCALAPSCWNQNFENFFIAVNCGKAFFSVSSDKPDCQQFSRQKSDRWALAHWMPPIRWFSLNAGFSLKTRQDLNSPICGSYAIITLLLEHLWRDTLNCSLFKRRSP